jgi:hypothetical protein
VSRCREGRVGVYLREHGLGLGAGVEPAGAACHGHAAALAGRAEPAHAQRVLAREGQQELALHVARCVHAQRLPLQGGQPQPQPQPEAGRGLVGDAEPADVRPRAVLGDHGRKVLRDRGEPAMARIELDLESHAVVRVHLPRQLW